MSASFPAHALGLTAAEFDALPGAEGFAYRSLFTRGGSPSVAMQRWLVDRDAAASLVQSMIQGSCMQWLIDREGGLAAFMLAQTRRVLTLLYPGHAFD